MLLFPDDVEWNLYSVDRGVFEKFGFNMDGYRCSEIMDDVLAFVSPHTLSRWQGNVRRIR